MRFRSWTRKYYCKVNEKFIKCKICERFLKKSSNNTGNIHRHIKLKHPYIYFRETNQKRCFHDDESSLEEAYDSFEEVFFVKNLTGVKSRGCKGQNDEAPNSCVEESLDKITDEDNIEYSVTPLEVEIKRKDKNDKTVVEKRFDTTKTRRYYSWSRKYYYKINDKFIKCRICNRLLKMNISNNGNILRHIKQKHPDIYFNETDTYESTKELAVEDSHYNKSDKAITQVFYIKELEKIVLPDDSSEVRDDDALSSDSGENIHRMSSVEETEQLGSNSKKEFNINSPSEGEVVEKQTDRKSYSWAWKYYDNINDKFIKCKICKRVFKMNNNGNVLRHMKLKHPDIYFKEKDVNASTDKQLPVSTGLQENDKACKQTLCIKKYVTKGPKFEDGDFFVPEEKLKVISLIDKPVVGKQTNTTNDRRNRSWTRKYYYKINDRLIKCRICQKLLNLNIHRHIKTKHPDIYLNENPQVQKPNLEEELRIKYLSEKAVVGSRTRTTKSCFWNFFEIVDQNRLYKCSFCQKIIAIFPKSVANLKRHIAKAHKKQYDIIMKYGDLKSRNSDVVAEEACEVEGVSSIEIEFLSLDDENSGKFKCTRCEEVIESGEEESDSVLIEHVQMCQLKPKPEKTESDANIIKSIEGQNNSM